MNPVLSYLFFIFCRFFFKIYCPLRVQGKDNLPSTSFIMCSNHCSHMDTPALMMATGLSFNMFGMIAAKDYFFKTTQRKSIASLFMNLIPINRKCTKTTFLQDIALCKTFINSRKGNLIIYPEGTRSLTGEIHTFKRGSAMIATELKIPIVPVYINGTYQSLCKGKNFPRRSQITITIGNPIYFDTDTSNQSVCSKKLTALLESKIKELKEKTV